MLITLISQNHNTETLVRSLFPFSGSLRYFCKFLAQPIKRLRKVWQSIASEEKVGNFLFQTKSSRERLWCFRRFRRLNKIAQRWYHKFLSKALCLTVLQRLAEKPFCVSETFSHRKTSCIGLRSTIFLGSFFSHMTEKFRTRNLMVFASISLYLA